MKVPDSVIIKSLQEEVKALRKKNHEVCTKAKEREAQWKAIGAVLYGLYAGKYRGFRTYIKEI